MDSVRRLMRDVIDWLVLMMGGPADPADEDSIDDDVLDAWLDEDEIDSSGL
jgi:hypothetical protein